ncbi:MAG: glycine betaine ABC transporter substrate-binding protein [[Clostridium] scindens]
MTEQYILGEMLDIMIEQDYEYEGKFTQGVGGGTSISAGDGKGEFDLYPEYAGTGWNMVLKKDGLYNEGLFKDMQKEYKETGYAVGWHVWIQQYLQACCPAGRSRAI